MAPIRVLIADDHSVLREGLRLVLELQPDIRVIGEAADGPEAVEKTRRLRPDLVLMDIAMPRFNGIEATRRIKRHCPETKILALTQFQDREYVLPILQAGAEGYILKQSDSREIIQGIQAAMRGESLLSPAIAKELVEMISSGGEPHPRSAETLTDREREVMILVAEGYTNRQISGMLDISPKTVDVHRTNFMRKLNLHNRVEVTRYALRHGLLPRS